MTEIASIIEFKFPAMVANYAIGLLVDKAQRQLQRSRRFLQIYKKIAWVTNSAIWKNTLSFDKNSKYLMHFGKKFTACW